MKLSILTATYNRGKLLVKLYESIIRNMIDNLEIEWLIMDDGSQDDTEEIVRNLKNVKGLRIMYFKQNNSGKMQSINYLMKYATGQLVMDCDSDDCFVDNAFKEIYQKSNVLLNDKSLYALVFLKNESKGKLSGCRFKRENVKTTMFDIYFSEEITGEKILVFNTDIRKKYKHELKNKEKFVTEARMYHKMDIDYNVKCFNIVIEEGEYLKNGYTSNIMKTFIEYPQGYYYYFAEILNRNMNRVRLNKRLYAIKHYILFEYLTKSKIKIGNIKGILNKLVYIFLIIPGRLKSSKFIKNNRNK